MEIRLPMRPTRSPWRLPASLALQGTLTATPQNGIATFSNLSVGTAGSLYTHGDQPQPHIGDQRQLRHHCVGRQCASTAGKTCIPAATDERVDGRHDRTGGNGRG